MTLATSRTFGVELEGHGLTRSQVERIIEGLGLCAHQTYYSDSQATYTVWKVKTDASIEGSNGFEVVSPILGGDSGLATLVRVIDALDAAGAMINKSCGVHVHWGVRDWDVAQFRNLFARYTKYEKALDSVMPASRRDNNARYCKSNVVWNAMRTLKDNVSRTWAAWSDVKTLRDLAQVYGRNRYFKLNMMSYWSHGTIEFRHHSGSFNSEKVARWVELTGAMVAQVDKKVRVKNFRNESPSTVDQLATMLKNMVDNGVLTQETAEFYKTRQAGFQA